MNTDDITPIVITCNEEPNIGRCLAGLAWARRIIVVDSGSVDRTLEICRQHPQVEILRRPFDSFARQCNFALGHVSSEWTLSLDADYIADGEFLEALRKANDQSDISGYRCPFRYCIHGRPLRGTLYPSRTVLYRTSRAQYEDDGHGHRVRVEGMIDELPALLDHDDRKPLDRWFRNQIAYTAREAEKLLATPRERLGRNDRIRLKGWLAPLLVAPYCLFIKRGILDGWAGWQYALERVIAEWMLALALVRRKIQSRAG